MIGCDKAVERINGCRPLSFMSTRPRLNFEKNAKLSANPGGSK
jgi:hypothetical protein